jgi:ABC-type lipoprotein release transport system permease subunit
MRLRYVALLYFVGTFTLFAVIGVATGATYLIAIGAVMGGAQAVLAYAIARFGWSTNRKW